MNFTSVVVAGRLARDPELRKTTDGRPCTNFTLVVNRTSRRRDGTVVDEPTYIDCALFGNSARSFAENHETGCHALVRGRLQQTRWTDAQGQEHTKLRVLVEEWQYAEPPEDVSDTESSDSAPE